MFLKDLGLALLLYHLTSSTLETVSERQTDPASSKT